MADFGPTPSFDEARVMDELVQTLNTTYPLNKMVTHQQERVKKLAELEKVKKAL